jgi:hypothetical protein
MSSSRISRQPDPLARVFSIRRTRCLLKATLCFGRYLVEGFARNDQQGFTPPLGFRVNMEKGGPGGGPFFISGGWGDMASIGRVFCTFNDRARIVALLVATTSALVASACGSGARDEVRAPYVRENLALLRSVPVVPHAKLVRTASNPYREREQDDAPVKGYGTTRVYNLPSGTHADSAVDFYRRELAGRWTEVAGSREYVSLKRGDAYLHILAGHGRLYVEVDYDCYKGDPSPHCFGP